MAGDERPLSVDELAEIAGTTPADVRCWQHLGLVGPGDTFTSSDLERARLVVYAARRGVPPHELARICEERGDMLEPFVTWALKSASGRFFSRQKVMERSGLPPDVFERIFDGVADDGVTVERLTGLVDGDVRGGIQPELNLLTRHGTNAFRSPWLGRAATVRHRHTVDMSRGDERGS